MDKIKIVNLKVEAILGVDLWERSKIQPIIMTITIYSDIHLCGSTDDLSLSISYSDVAKQVKLYTQSTSFNTMQTLAYSIMRLCFSLYKSTMKIKIMICKPKGLLHALYPGVIMQRTRDQITNDSNSMNPSLLIEQDVVLVKDLTLHTIVGINPFERGDKQVVIINLEMYFHFDKHQLVSDILPPNQNCRSITTRLSKVIQESKFLTIEALISSISEILVLELHIPGIKISINKPSALMFAESACIEIKRSKKDYPLGLIKPNSEQFQPIDGEHTVYIAFGTNLGDRSKNIHDALDALDKKGVLVTNSSFLYESSPMYLTDQPLFLNGVVECKTRLNPYELLTLLKSIEHDLGRDLNSKRNGPRTIDLDILFYDESFMIDTESLTIPHKSIQERYFVLMPLVDIIPHHQHPKLLKSIQHLLQELRSIDPSFDGVYRVTPIGNRLIKWDSKHTLLMGVLNVTPDSFFDGGLCDTVDKAVRRVIDMQKGGCDIVDIGGQSTRPGAQEISIKEELERVIPVIEALRMNGETRDHVIISIDTFQARVAQEAIEAGANMINDVTGGEYCGDEMMRVWKVSRVPVCIMHMRGNPRTMTTLNVYENKSVMKEVHKEMCLKVSEMIQYGIKRWNIIVDPGIGFAKNMDQNYELIQNLKMLVERGECIRMPVLLGVSRKGFIGKTVGDCDAQSEERKWGTAAACTAGIAGGCSILRVHDVKEMKSVALVADKCFK